MMVIMVIDMEINDLQQLVRSGNLGAVSELIEEVILSNGITALKNTPLLHLAIESFDLNMVIYLVNRLPELIDQLDHNKRTALHICALAPPPLRYESDFDQIVELLLRNGMDINATDKNKQTAEDIAQKQENYWFLRVLTCESNVF